MACTFIGQKNAPSTLERNLRKTILKLVLNDIVETFYISGQGKFDEMVLYNLHDIWLSYPHIKYYVVLDYLPKKFTVYDYPTEIVEGIDKVPKKYAMDFRNKWMIDNSDIVVTYVTQRLSGAAKLVEQAKQKEKRIIDLTDNDLFL